MNTDMATRSTPPQRTAADWISDQLRELGYTPCPARFDDPLLIEIAGRATWTSPLGVNARVRATCACRGLKVPAGFSQGLVHKASIARLRAFAAQAQVPLRWLITGREGIDQQEGLEPGEKLPYPDDFDDGRLGYPDFLMPYIELREATNSLRDLGRTRGSDVQEGRGLSSDNPDDLVVMLLALLRKMKETEHLYTARIAREAAYWDELKLVKPAVLALQEITHPQPWRTPTTTKTLAEARADLVAAIEASSFNIAYVRNLLPELGIDEKVLAARIGNNFTEWVWKTDDMFYKLRPDGEGRYYAESIPFLPWVHLMMSYTLSYERSLEERDFTITVNREEMEWLIHGFGEQYMHPETPEDEEDERESGLWTRKCALHRKLFTVMDCEPQKTIGKKTARPKKAKGRPT